MGERRDLGTEEEETAPLSTQLTGFGNNRTAHVGEDH